MHWRRVTEPACHGGGSGGSYDLPRRCPAENCLHEYGCDNLSGVAHICRSPPREAGGGTRYFDREVVSVARLTKKQERFVAEYLIDLNATQAAIRAGYSQKTADRIGPELLGKTCVSEAIQKAMREREKRTEITQDSVLHELALIAFTDRSAFARVSGGGRIVELTDTEDLSAEQRAVLAGVEETKYGIKVSTYDKVRALELLGKHLGLFDGSGKENQGGVTIVDDV